MVWTCRTNTAEGVWGRKHPFKVNHKNKFTIETGKVQVSQILCHLSVPFLNKQHSLRSCASATKVKMLPSDRLEICVIIKFCHDLGKMPTQALKMIEQTKRDHLVSRSLVFKWHRRFAVSQDSL